MAVPDGPPRRRRLRKLRAARYHERPRQVRWDERDIERTLTFDDVIAVLRSRLGQQVKVGREEKGRIANGWHGVLEPADSHLRELVPEDDGRVLFRVVPGASFQLVPGLVSEAQQHSDGKLLRVVMRSGAALVIELLGPRASESRPHRSRAR